jgi:hypothetical protein
VIRSIPMLGLIGALATGIAGEATAARTMEHIEGAYELVLRDVELPATAVGSLTLKPCAECDPITLRAAPATEYSFIGGEALPLRDFLAQVAHLRETGRDGSAGVGVFYDLASKRVTRVVVVPAN